MKNLTSPDYLREVNLMSAGADERSKQYQQLQARGVYPVAMQVHSQVRIVRGRMFRRNCREVIVGSGVARQRKIEVGDQLALGRVTWSAM